MEGKKYRAFGEDCKAVSEVYGQLLMISIVVLAFSGIGLTLFSEGGIGNPQLTPHTDFQENINPCDDTIQILHVGGEAITLDEIKVVLSGNGNQTEFDGSGPCVTVLHPNGSVEPKNGDFMLGDCMEINTIGEKVNLMSGDAINMFFVHTPSQQVIQKTVLQRVSWEPPEWITPYPYGSVYDSSAPSRWLPIDTVGAIGDGLFTEAPVPKESESMYEEYEFGVKAHRMQISNTLKPVQLKIIYESHDTSNNNLTLSIYNGSTWTQIKSNMEEYHSFDDCKEGNLTYDISSCVKSADELEKLKVKFLVIGNAATPSGKTILVDFVGVHIEF